MEQGTSEIDVAIPYAQYNALQKHLNHVKAENTQLKSQLKQVKQDCQMEKEKKKELESRIQTLSKISLQNSRKVMDLEGEKQKANTHISELKQSILGLENKIQAEKALKQESLSKIDTLAQRNHHLEETLTTLQNRLGLKEQQVYQLIIEISQKSKSLRKLSEKYIEVQYNLQHMKIKERIIVDDGEADYNDLREQIRDLENLNKKLKDQNADMAEKLAHLTLIANEYQKDNKPPQISLIQAYRHYLQNYKAKLIQASMSFQQILQQLQSKRASLECAFSRSFQQTLQKL